MRSMQVRGDELLQLFDLAGDQSAAIREVYADAKDRTEAWALWTEFTLYALRDERRRAELVDAQRHLHAGVVDMVKRQCREAGVRPPVPVDTLARMYTALFQGLWQQQAVDPDGVTDEVFTDAVVFLRRAVEQLGKPRS